MPIVSVIMPVYNGEKYLHEAIESILVQTYTDFELIIINDGSTDNTETIALSYDDPRIVYIKNEKNLELASTLNKGISFAKGKYIARMDADDISLAKRLEKQIEYMNNNCDIDVCGTWLSTFGGIEEVWPYPVTHDEIKAFLLFKSSLAHPTVIFKRSFFDDFSYSQEFEKAEDYNLWSISIDHKRFANIPEVLYHYRIHPEMTNLVSIRTQKLRANKIRIFLLEKFEFHPNDKEWKLHQDIVYHMLNIKKIGDYTDWLNKIKSLNYENNNFNREALDRTIGEYWWQLFSQNTDQGLKVFLAFIHSDFLKNKRPGFFKLTKFFVKCMFKYRYRQTVLSKAIRYDIE